MRCLLSAVFLFLTYIGYSQDYVDLLNSEYQTTPQNQYKNDSSETKVQGVTFNVLAPIKINSKIAILTDFTYDHTKLQYDPKGKEINLIGYTFKAGANINHNSKLNGTYVVIPKWASDRDKWTSRHFQLGGAAILKYQKNDHLKYILGAYFNNEFFGPFTTPLFGFYYKKNKWEANVMLPAVTDINYQTSKRSLVGFHFRSIAKSYNFNTGLIGTDDEYMVQMSNEASLYLGKEIFKSVFIKAYIGHTMGRSYRVYAQGDQIDLGFSAFRLGDDRVQLNQDFKNGLFFRIGLNYRYYLKE